VSWRVVLALGLLGLALGFAWGIADEPAYRATAGVAVESDSQGGDPARLERFAQRGESRRVASVAAGLLGGDVSGADLLADVKVSPAPSGGAVIVTAESRSPDYAAAAAEAWAEALVKVEGNPLAAGAVAEIPSSPYRNRSAALWSAIGALVGLLAGVLLAAIHARADRRHASSGPPVPTAGGQTAPPDRPSPPDVEAAAEAGPHAELAVAPPVLGTVSASTADLAALRPALEELGLDAGGEGGSLAVATVADDDAGARVGLALALAAADAGTRVLLVDTDFEEPAVAALLEIDEEPGLSDYLEGTAGPREVVRPVRVGVPGVEPPIDIACIPAGRGDAAGALAGSRFEGLVERLARIYELVVYVAAPAATEEATAVTRLAGMTVLATGSEASADESAGAIRLLADAEIAGSVACEA